MGSRARSRRVLGVVSFSLAAAMGFLLGGSLSIEDVQETTIDWDKVKSAFRDYLKDPVPENAKLFLDTLPKERTSNDMGDENVATLYIYDNCLSFESGVLGVLAGDAYLAEAAFRLLNFSDAAFSEALREILANLATRNPKLFLKLLEKYKASPHIKRVGYPVYGTTSYAREEILSEWRKRIEALKTVKETKYRQIRDECIRLLEGAIKYPPDWLDDVKKCGMMHH